MGIHHVLEDPVLIALMMDASLRWIKIGLSRGLYVASLNQSHHGLRCHMQPESMYVCYGDNFAR